MEQIIEIFRRALDRTTSGWKTLSTTKKILMLSFFVVAFVGVATLFVLQEETQYKYLFIDVSDEDTAAIIAYLKANNFEDYTVDAKGIRVPVDQMASLRIKLSTEGIPNKGVIGWEKFDEEGFTRTEFEQEVQKLRAIQGELARTITGIEGITSARVHIVMPRTSLFIREKKPPTAAIYIKTKRNFSIEKKQIKGIQHLVSRSVEGLEPFNITILDSEGRMLTEIESQEETAKQTKELLAFKTNVEKKLEQRILSIVGRIVGPDRVEAKVDVEADFTQESQTISDIDPDDIAVVAKNTSGFSMEGQGLNPTGIPGSKSNVPGEQEDLVLNQSKAGSKRDTEILNYEFSKVVSQKTLPVGTIKRITVSALVDGKQIYPLDGTVPAFEPRTPEEMKKIEELIKNAVGFKDGRDSITVQNMMFQLDPFQMMAISKKKKEDREYISTLAISAAIALFLLLFFAFIVRPYFHWLSYDPEKKKEQSIIEEYKPDLELGSMQNVQIQEDVPFDKLSPKEQVLFIARNEPKRTTEAIRIMLNPNAHG